MPIDNIYICIAISITYQAASQVRCTYANHLSNKWANLCLSAN